MYVVKDDKLLWDERPVLTRDFIINEDILKEIEYEKEKNSYVKLVVIDGMLIYVIKYFELDSVLSNSWHFAFQSLNEKGMVYLYESCNLYLGE